MNHCRCLSPLQAILLGCFFIRNVLWVGGRILLEILHDTCLQRIKKKEALSCMCMCVCKVNLQRTTFIWNPCWYAAKNRHGRACCGGAAGHWKFGICCCATGFLGFEVAFCLRRQEAMFSTVLCLCC
ncbi:uncharacterized protein LOC129315064 isoform X1 [Prosopis cineraria]|uniref:uncharacterized protein LOC129315064 isoform X1 n=1 Tax=Prosopis cineraria TaxID=364024 RepID=UPI00240FA1C5|nr:uncharacterized protein LOC129315064 isoform X1 [Prosopis cineraria]